MDNKNKAVIGLIMGINIAIAGAFFENVWIMIIAINILFGTFFWVTR